jgi:formylglycine-generating enzyme required for sulfatase activity
LLNPGLPFNTTANPGLGVFIYRNANETGAFSATGVQLRWNYGATGVNDDAVIDIRVFAIELAFIPQESFYAGSGGTEYSAFYKYPTSTSPFQVTSEGEISVGTAIDNLYYNYTLDGGDQLGPVPAAFPKGYAAFYCMKYEISQQGYVDFLNCLTQTQANRRKYNGATYRYAITGNTAGSYTTTNPYVACNYLNWADLAAYFDWSGLRPITELEYEKSCRGPLPAVPNEFAWGTTAIATGQNTLSNNGDNNENIASNYSATGGNATYGLTTPIGGTINGPVRGGIFAAHSGNTGRVTAGATYYGIMEMTGNLLEHFVTVGNPTGRSFTGMHGNGTVNTYGNADVTNWPGTNSNGAGFRGGYWYIPAQYVMVSDRSGAAGTDANRYHSDGGRGGRTAPSLN